MIELFGLSPTESQDELTTAVYDLIRNHYMKPGVEVECRLGRIAGKGTPFSLPITTPAFINASQAGTNFIATVNAEGFQKAIAYLNNLEIVDSKSMSDTIDFSYPDKTRLTYNSKTQTLSHAGSKDKIRNIDCYIPSQHRLLCDLRFAVAVEASTTSSNQDQATTSAVPPGYTSRRRKLRTSYVIGENSIVVDLTQVASGADVDSPTPKWTYEVEMELPTSVFQPIVQEADAVEKEKMLLNVCREFVLVAKKIMREVSLGATVSSPTADTPQNDFGKRPR
eukprot:PhF_6_TR21959/c0_g1_i2/m.31223